MVRNEENSVLRSLGIWEKLFWLYDRAHPLHFALTAQIQGEFTAAALKQSLASVQQRHPLLRVRIALDESERPWFVEDLAKIPLRVVQRESEQQWQRYVEQELSTPFVWAEAPLIRTVLLHSTDISELIVLCHHAIADGLSALYLIRDILQALTNSDTSVQPLPVLPAIEYLLPGKAAENSASYPPFFIQLIPHEAPLLQSCSCLCAGSLPAEITTQLISRCRQEQTSVHAAICAAFLIAITRQNRSEQPQTLKCISPISLRPYLTPAIQDNVGLYASGKQTLHTLTSNAKLWELAYFIKQTLSQEMAPNKIFAEVPDSEKMPPNLTPAIVRQIIREQFSRDLVVTNLGRLTFPLQFERLQLQAIYGPAGIMGMENERVVGVTTVGEQLFFTLVCPESVMSSAAAENLKDEAIQLLRASL